MARKARDSNDGSTSARRAVLIDDDDLFRETLEQNLTESGFSVTAFADGASALKAVGDGFVPDIVLLDWKMPEMNGIEVLRRFRDTAMDAPVIFLTALSDQVYEEAALLGGAVDFVEKSRSFGIVLKRIELIIGGTKSAAGSAPRGADAGGTIEAGALMLIPDSHLCRWKDIDVPLTIAEFKIVDTMIRNRGKDLSYREIYDVVRGEGFAAGQGLDGYRQNVRTAIKRIRRKFKHADGAFDQIENYPGYGYRWRDDDT